MNDDREQRRSAEDAEIEREIRQGRKFGAKEAMARMAGPGAMKGASPVSPVQQAETELGTWLRANVVEAGDALPVILHRQLAGSELLLERLDRPLDALAEYCRSVLASEYLLKEIVREADVEWGRAMDEPPYFERENAPPHPDDPFTAETVREALEDILKRLSDGIG